MYRRLVPLMVAAFVALSVATAYWPDRTSPVLARVTAYAYLGFPRSFHPGGDLALTIVTFLKNGVLVLAGVALVWAGSFHPTRRLPAWLAAAKLSAGPVHILFAAAVIYQKALAAGQAAAVLAGQTGRSPGLLLAVDALHGLLTVAGLALILTAPLFWLVRSVQVRSLRRSAFEAWLQARRLVVFAAILLLLGAIAETYVSPYMTAWLLQQGFG